MLIVSPRLDKDHALPLYAQLYETLKQDIISGKLPTGSKLPSIRDLAKHLHISRNTVETAYQQLLAEGYVISKPKSGLYVKQLELDAMEQHSGPLPKRREDLPVSEPVLDIDFEYGTVDMSAFPMKTWKKYSNLAYSQECLEMNSYGHDQGEPSLRQEIAKYLYYSRGVVCSAEQIIITSGTQHSLNLLCETVFGGRNVFAMEQPGYDRVRYVFDHHKFTTVPISLDRDGIRVEHLQETKADIVYITPSHQYPFGMVMPFNRRLELLLWAKENHGFIIEDDYDGEFRYESKPIPALKALDRHENIIYLGTFSKTLLPSLRISYMVLPESLWIQHSQQFKNYLQTVPRVIQNTLYYFMRDGEWDRHVRRMRLLYQKKHTVLVEAIHHYLGDHVEIIGEKAGLHLLIQVKGAFTEDELIKAAAAVNVKVYSTDKYWMLPKQDASCFIMLGFSSLSIEKMEEGIRRLKTAWFS